MKNIFLFSLLLSFCVWIGCSKPPMQPNNPGHGLGNAYNKSCDSVYCTLEIRSISIDVVDKAGSGVALDSFYVTDNNGKMPNVLYGAIGNNGSYMIFNDSWVNGHQKTTTDIRFIGFKNGSKIVDEPYRIATDCCHVQKTKGNSQVIIP